MNEPSSTTQAKSRFFLVRFLRWLFSWRMIRRYLFCLACLVTLIALFYAEENWRGKHAWEKYRQAEEAKGEKFDFSTFIPPPVPDDQNFATTPFLANLFDFNPKPLKPGQTTWRDTNATHEDFSLGKVEPEHLGNWAKGESTDLAAWAVCLQTGKKVPATAKSTLTRMQAATEVLNALEKFNPVFEELQTASHRPYARFNINYNEPNPMGILLPNLGLMRRAGMIYQMRASAELELGRSDQALKDTEMILYLGDSIKNEPFLISGLVHVALVQRAGLQTVWEGLASHQWSDAQLAELTQQLEKPDLLAEGAMALQGERAFSIAGIDYLRGFGNADDLASDGRSTGTPFYLMPSGWFDQNKLAICRLHQQGTLTALNAAEHRVYTSHILNEAQLSQELDHRFLPYNFFARMLFPALAKCMMKYANAQANLDEAALACALERYRLAHGAYPETLDSLSPQFIAHIPHDLFTGEPLKYHRTDDGHFVLYSIGWNGKDDGGEVVMTKSKTPSLDVAQGDWVWPQYPAP